MSLHGKATLLLHLCLLLLLFSHGEAFQLGIKADVPPHSSRSKRSSVNSACLDLLTISPLRLPNIKDKYHVEAPWMRPGVRVFTNDNFLFNWNWIKTLNVRGLNETVEDVVRYLDENNCLYIPWGEAVRDALVGTAPLDIDGEVSCSNRKVYRLCVEKYGARHCGKAPTDEMSKLVVGYPAAANRPYSVTADPLDLSPWLSTFHENSTFWDYTANALALFDDQAGNVYLVDLTGTGKDHACKRKIFPTAEIDGWDKWTNNDYMKVMRSYKLRLNGFDFGDHTVRDYLKKQVQRLQTREKLEDFYCQYVLDGIGARRNSTSFCYVKDTTDGTERRRRNFDSVYFNDFTYEYAAETLIPVQKEVKVFTFDKMPTDIIAYERDNVLIDFKTEEKENTAVLAIAKKLEIVPSGGNSYFNDRKSVVEPEQGLSKSPDVERGRSSSAGGNAEKRVKMKETQEAEISTSTRCFIGVLSSVGAMCVFFFILSSSV